MKMYKKILVFLDATLIGILIGIITSVVINVLTSLAIDAEVGGLIFLHVMSIICLIGLLRIRQKYDEERSKQLAGTSESNKIANSIDEEKKANYLAYLIIAIITFFAGIWIVVKKIKRKEFEDAKVKSCKQCEKNGVSLDSIIKRNVSYIGPVKDSVQIIPDTSGKK